MILIDWIYVVFAAAVVGLAAWKRADPPAKMSAAVATVYIGALVLLPAAAYRDIEGPQYDFTKTVPVWFIGILIPTRFLLINKGWIAPLCALLFALISKPASLSRFRFHWVDVPVLAYAALPLIQRLFGPGDPNLSTLASSLLVFGCWVLPWFLGRAFFCDRQGRLALVDSLIYLSLLIIPIAVIEGLSKLRVHELLYGKHPFGPVGIDRYFGYRPMAFFEDGNQYGIWICCVALLAWWRARNADKGDNRAVRWLVALILLGTAVASQSVGAIVLLVIALPWLELAPWLERNVWIYRMALASAASLVVLLLAGTLSPARLGITTGRIAQIADIFHDFGRQSLQWRIGRALDNLSYYKDHLFLGGGRSDWTPIFRPWDLPSNILGINGLVGFGLIVLMIAGAVYRRRWQRPARKGSTRYAFIAVIGMAIGDACMNTYVFLPALAFLGALAPVRHMTPPRKREERRHYEEDSDIELARA